MGKDATGDNIISRALANGLRQEATTQFDKTDEALGRGAREQADEHYQRAMNATGDYLLNPSSIFLTPDENERWRKLINSYQKIGPGGVIYSTHNLTEHQQAELDRLDKKAFGGSDK